MCPCIRNNLHTLTNSNNRGAKCRAQLQARVLLLLLGNVCKLLGKKTLAAAARNFRSQHR
jgi:hypothetical protein